MEYFEAELEDEFQKRGSSRHEEILGGERILNIDDENDKKR